MASDSKKYFYLDRNKEFIACELVEETPYKREVKFLEGDLKGKNKFVHPAKVAWGGMFPRLFQSHEKPENPFIFKGRVLLNQQQKGKLIPDLEPNYRFQNYMGHIIDSINMKENLLLTGGTGAGKTSQILQLAARINQPVLRANFNGETRLSDFIGKMHVIDGETRWIDGILPLAMKNGYWLLLDEIDFADPSILSLLHPVLEDNPVLVLKENDGEVIKPHKDFRIFGTANSIGAMQDKAGSYGGTNQMNEAFIDRWQVILVPALPEKEEIKVLKAKVEGIKTVWVKRMVEFANKVRNNKLENFEFASDSFSTRRLIAWAKKSALLGSPILGAKLAWLDKMSASDQEIIKRILETHFGPAHRTRQSKKQGVSFTASSGKKKAGRPKKVVNVVTPQVI